MPGDSGVLVYSCAFYHYQVHTRPRVQRAPGIPHALFGRKINARLGRIAPRDRETASDEHERTTLSAVIASAAKQSIFLSFRGKMDCFAALAMTVEIVLDCFAERVIRRAFERPAARAMTRMATVFPGCCASRRACGVMRS